MRLRLTPLARSLEPRCHDLAQRVERLLTRDLEACQSEELRKSLSVVIRTINDQVRLQSRQRTKATP
jgi:hypothetical protein